MIKREMMKREMMKREMMKSERIKREMMKSERIKKITTERPKICPNNRLFSILNLRYVFLFFFYLSNFLQSAPVVASPSESNIFLQLLERASEPRGTLLDDSGLTDSAFKDRRTHVNEVIYILRELKSQQARLAEEFRTLQNEKDLLLTKFEPDWRTKIEADFSKQANLRELIHANDFPHRIKPELHFDFTSETPVLTKITYRGNTVDISDLHNIHFNFTTPYDVREHFLLDFLYFQFTLYSTFNGPAKSPYDPIMDLDYISSLLDRSRFDHEYKLRRSIIFPDIYKEELDKIFDENGKPRDAQLEPSTIYFVLFFKSLIASLKNNPDNLMSFENMLKESLKRFFINFKDEFETKILQEHAEDPDVQQFFLKKSVTQNKGLELLHDRNRLIEKLKQLRGNQVLRFEDDHIIDLHGERVALNPKSESTKDRLVRPQILSKFDRKNEIELFFIEKARKLSPEQRTKLINGLLDATEKMTRADFDLFLICSKELVMNFTPYQLDKKLSSLIEVAKFLTSSNPDWRAIEKWNRSLKQMEDRFMIK